MSCTFYGMLNDKISSFLNMQKKNMHHRGFHIWLFQESWMLKCFTVLKSTVLFVLVSKQPDNQGQAEPYFYHALWPWFPASCLQGVWEKVDQKDPNSLHLHCRGGSPRAQCCSRARDKEELSISLLSTGLTTPGSLWRNMMTHYGLFSVTGLYRSTCLWTGDQAVCEENSASSNGKMCSRD